MDIIPNKSLRSLSVEAENLEVVVGKLVKDFSNYSNKKFSCSEGFVG